MKPYGSPLPEDEAITAAWPTRSGRHDLYAEAARLVRARHSKGALVALVNWLLHRVERADTAALDAAWAQGHASGLRTGAEIERERAARTEKKGESVRDEDRHG